MLRSPEIDSWIQQLSEDTELHIGVIQAMWDNYGEIVSRHGETLENTILERKSLIQTSLNFLSWDEERVLRRLGLWGLYPYGRYPM